MKYAVLINALLSPAQMKGVLEHMELVESLLGKAVKLGPAEDVHVVADAETFSTLGNLVKDHRKITVKNRKASAVLSDIYKALRDYECCIYFFIDTPLIDVNICTSMLDLHRNEIVEYTFGEGYPVGVAPEILNVDLLPKLISLLGREEDELKRDTVFSCLQKEINSFDIETHFAEQDMKLKRIELALSPRRYSIITERVIERAGIECSYDQFCRLVGREPGILRSLPSFVEIEVTNRTNGPCPYQPHDRLDRERGDMDIQTYGRCLDQFSSFTDHYYIAFSNMGEPLLNPHIRTMIEYTLDRPDVHLLFESDGHLFTPDFTDYVTSLHSDRISFVFDVDAVQDETYRSVHGGNLKRVERNIRYLLSKSPENVYVQMVRMDDNENEMLAFYDRWEADGARIIIQKYNNFCGLLPTRSHADLRPLDRQPCWHLMRDLVVLNNGDVPRCKQDINASFPLGNIRDLPVDDIWLGNEQVYLDHCKGIYDELCETCDEYYTFNF
jgi:spiro-SPASM protein